MRNTKAIDPSLNKKIKENDERLRELYEKGYKIAGLTKANTGRNRSFQKSQKRKKNNDDSFSDINIKTYNDIDVEPSPQTADINSKVSKTIDIEKKSPPANVSHMQKRMKFKKDKEEKKNNTTLNINNNSVNKSRKIYNKEQVDEMVNRLYNNNYKRRKHQYKEEENKKDLENEPDIGEFIERLEEDKKKRNENLENIKKELLDNEKELYTYKPKMCEGSKKYNESKKDTFFERQKNYNEKKTQKEEKLKETIKKQQEDEIKENNILLKKRNDKKKEETKETSDKNNKADVDKTIKDLFEWEEKRKKKLEDQQKEETHKIETANDYVPKINKKSQKLAEKNKLKIKQPNVFNRLAAHDQILKEKKKILIDMYTPSFQPRSYVPRNMNLEKIKKKGNYMATKDNQNEEEEEDEDDDKKKKKKEKSKKKKEDSDEENEDEENEEDEDNEEDEEKEDNDEESEEKKKKSFDFKQDTMKYADDDVQDALRNSLFKKKKKIK